MVGRKTSNESKDDRYIYIWEAGRGTGGPPRMRSRKEDKGEEEGEKGEGKRRRYRLIDLVDRLPVPQGRHQLIFGGPGEATELLTAK